jgi:hypothetical protein
MVNVLDTVFKDPDAVLDYGFNWAPTSKSWLLPGDTIVSSTWIVPAGLTSPANSFTTTTTTVRIVGGTVGVIYVITNRITTANGLVDDRSIGIKVVDR